MRSLHLTSLISYKKKNVTISLPVIDTKKKCINFEDIQNAFKLLLKDEKFKSRKDGEDNKYQFSMYT